MNKSELIAAIATKTDATQKQAGEFLNAFIDVVGGTLKETRKEGGQIQVTGFGTFKTSYREAREGKNPKNMKETVQIPACYVTYFSAGKQLKEVINSAAATKAKASKKVQKKKKK